ncbi:hypothetical protein [Pseudoduganella aquatica]|uniref:Uncharacterized protein n=1 Tax=Pseudoduganella aquatica TaxID=2660641 RepID=A0A7X4HFA3_9BURK|nr:hypothetical protein [Pseudoduganella aquatica]MYN09713.1 hypothetical protein [Pseudoduganella aquatica]
MNFLIKDARIDGPVVLVDPPLDEALAAPQAAALDTALACLDAASSGKITAAPACAYAPGGETGVKLAAAQAAQIAKPAYWRSRASEIDNLPASASQLRTARKTFGDLPLVVLARSDAAQATAAQHLASLSTRGRSVALPDTGLPLLFAQPEAVSAAVLQVLEALEKPQP